jgi:hypothetical protein
VNRVVVEAVDATVELRESEAVDFVIALLVRDEGADAEWPPRTTRTAHPWRRGDKARALLHPGPEGTGRDRIEGGGGARDSVREKRLDLGELLWMLVRDA